MALIGTNMNVAVTKTEASAIAVTGITNANPPVVTSAAHGLSDGAIVVLAISDGMVELDGQIARIANSSTNDFELENLDSSSFSTFGSGGTYTVTPITAWDTIAKAQGVSAPDPAPNKIDITTLIDQVKQYVFGLPDAPDGSVALLTDPTDAAIVTIRSKTRTNGALAFRISWAGGQKHYFNAYVSGGQGFELQQNQAATSKVAFTPIKEIVFYAS